MQQLLTTRRAVQQQLSLRVALVWAMAVVAIATIVPPTAARTSAQGVSQVVLSCTTPPPQSHTTKGCRSTEGDTTPFIVDNGTLFFVAGFWVWCGAPTSGTPYGSACAGSMYAEEIDLETGEGHYDATSVGGSSAAGGTTGLQVSFTSSDGDLTCVLDVPTSPTNGPSNSLTGTCNGVAIGFSNSVVHVTGS